MDPTHPESFGPLEGGEAGSALAGQLPRRREQGSGQSHLEQVAHHERNHSLYEGIGQIGRQGGHQPGHPEEVDHDGSGQEGRQGGGDGPGRLRGR